LVINFWTNMAKFGQPGRSASGLNWPQATTANLQQMYFSTPASRVVTDYNHVNCDFWDNVVGYGWV
jgi:hypothetical protein